MSKQTNSMVVKEDFNSHYFELHNHIFKCRDFFQESRNGKTHEMLNFKTILQNPIKRCVGGYNRNTNIFFLLAEAMWIWVGRRDVAFLKIFNSNMEQYSDNGKYFHAPYGWRLRNWGIHSMQEYSEENKHAIQGMDQIAIALRMLVNKPEDRRVVCGIWNPEFDLGVDSKDLPCNDLLMFKIRGGKLYQTIQNRSNDLNLGLTTNIFQFSFIGEIMSKILDVELGDQVHNSQSLHIYEGWPVTKQMQENYDPFHDTKLLYDISAPIKMNFNLEECNTVQEKLAKIDFFLKGIIATLLKKNNHKKPEPEDNVGDFEDSLFSFSSYFYYVYKLLCIYVSYKNKNLIKKEACIEIYQVAEELNFKDKDITNLALNFFMIRMKDKEVENFSHLQQYFKARGHDGAEMLGYL